jgi:hypothetical protein
MFVAAFSGKFKSNRLFCYVSIFGVVNISILLDVEQGNGLVK